ncbi:hypothetical protein GWI33_003360 [Rhynchophorus ferrugineus]|uniref:Uncharacterized protein n=1 Tax=Rhynchophorus ferrugineus TaxID=354439 RepID=A0A834IWK0_RHYFE|nr:hypothetical protein GWI33_003360 [Rhynchophorus ferrugineus]
MMINVLNDRKYGSAHRRNDIPRRLSRAFLKAYQLTKMVENKEGKPIAIVQVVVPREKRRIFAVDRLIHQVVKVQAQSSNGRRVQ